MSGQSSEDTDAVFTALAGAYYPLAAASGSEARRRATAAQSISAISATALIASFILTAVDKLGALSLGLAWLAIALWIVSTALYMRAVSSPVKPVNQRKNLTSKSDFIDEILNKAALERGAINKRQQVANIVSLSALAVSLLTLVAYSIDRLPDEEHLILNTDSTAAPAIEKLCGASIADLQVTADPSPLTLVSPPTYIQFRVADNRCSANGALITIETAAIESVVHNG